MAMDIWMRVVGEGVGGGISIWHGGLVIRLGKQ
jgi:hypothetical protein